MTASPTRDQLIGFAQRCSDDAWLNGNTHTAEMFAAIVKALQSPSVARTAVSDAVRQLREIGAAATSRGYSEASNAYETAAIFVQQALLSGESDRPLVEQQNEPEQDARGVEGQPRRIERAGSNAAGNEVSDGV